MPLEEIQAVISTSDLAARNELIAGHLRRIETTLARTHVTDHALAVEGPIREYYVVGPHETNDESQWQAEIGWPIFDTG